MNTKVITGIVAVLAVIIVGWWYLTQMLPASSPEAVTATSTPEDGAMSANPSERVKAGIVGSWKSDDDAKFTRVFTADGSVVDRYDGVASATATGQWSIVTDLSQEPAGLPVVKDATIVKIEFPEEVLYFGVTGLTETELTMLYLGGNGTLHFTRI